MYHLNTFKYYKTYGTDYVLDGSAGEGISWRNVCGQPILDVTRDMNNVLAVGIYTLTMNVDSYGAFYSMLGSINVVMRGDWADATDYTVNDVVNREGTYSHGSCTLWRCIQAHNSSIIIPGAPGANTYWAPYYSLDETNTLNPMCYNISAYDASIPLSPVIDTTPVAIDAGSGDYQPQLISGLKIKFNNLAMLSKVDKFQIIIGGRWLKDEDRFQKDLIFGIVSANGNPATSAVTISVQNNSGTTLKNLRATVINKVSVYQSQHFQSDVCDIANKLSPYYDLVQGGATGGYGQASNQPFQSHPLDIIVPMTGINSPTPIRSYSSIVRTAYQVGADMSWTPFSRNFIIPSNNTSSFPTGWAGAFYHYTTDTNDPLYAPLHQDFITAPIIKPVKDFFNTLSYDFGRGNFVCPNVMGLTGLGIGNTGISWPNSILYGSQDDIDVPQNWEVILEGFAVGPQAVSGSGGNWHYGRFIYQPLANHKHYRHFLLDFKTFPYGSMYTRIQLMELLYVNTAHFDSITRTTPFLVINQNGELNPQWSSGDYPHDVRFINAQRDVVDMTIRGNAYDVYEVMTGNLISGGAGLKIDGLTQYRMSDDSPYPGFTFVLSVEFGGSAEIYVSPGADVFQIRANDLDLWKTSGAQCNVTDAMNDQSVFTLEIRANPLSGDAFDIDGAAEGLLQVCGDDDNGDTYLTSIPLHAVVARQFSPLNLRANCIDSNTINTLAEFGITETS